MTRWSYDPRQANKGKQLENDIEVSIKYYQYQKIALIRKVPTPIKPLKVDYKRKIITKAVFEQKSSVDYEGNYKGIHIAFDAKETSQKYFPLKNVKNHQYEHLKINHDLGGLSFLIVAFKHLGEIFFLPFTTLDEYWILATHGKRKSIPYSDFYFEIEPGRLLRLDFLKNIDEYLKMKGVA